VKESALLWLLCLLPAAAVCAEEAPELFFKCSFESKEEVETLEGELRGKFVKGIKGNAANILGGSFCKFPSERCIPPTDATLSIWMYPHWNMGTNSQAGGRAIIVCPSGKGHLYDHFTVLSYGYNRLSMLAAILREKGW